jgi:hypothetical protein
LLVDTGASLSGFDESLEPALGRPRGTRDFMTPVGPTRVEEFDWPKAELRGQPLATDQPVMALNLAGLRQATNEKIYGVIGMDVLRNCRVQIDFDAGLIRFLETLPANTGKLPGGRDPEVKSDEKTKGSLRVLRGGGWGYLAASCRSGDRLRDRPGFRNFFLGFRPALSPVRPDK